jgi:mannose-6-phosphate isomerase-like protein (cupin superfamily)
VRNVIIKFELETKLQDEDTMGKFFLLALLALALLPTTAQEAAPAGFEQWTAPSLKQFAEELSKEAAGTTHHSATKRLSDYPNELFLLARREANGVPEWHETQADIFVVESGSATLLVGGTLEGAETTEPHEKRNGTIHGGIRRKLSAGDVIRIAAKTPHQLLLDGAKEFTYFVVKVKGY